MLRPHIKDLRAFLHVLHVGTLFALHALSLAQTVPAPLARRLLGEATIMPARCPTQRDSTCPYGTNLAWHARRCACARRVPVHSMAYAGTRFASGLAAYGRRTMDCTMRNATAGCCTRATCCGPTTADENSAGKQVPCHVAAQQTRSERPLRQEACHGAAQHDPRGE